MARTIGVAVACGVLLLTQIAFAESASRRSYIHNEPTLRGLASLDSSKLNQLEKAYLDVFTILRDDNACSRLYGGRRAIEALNELVSQLRPTYLDGAIAIRMSGKTTIFQNNLTGFYFRIFDKAEINLGGPFYRSNTPSSRRVPLVASYQPNTRETRIVVLLHELGHLVKGQDNKWVLSDDGGDQMLSVRNSEYVLGVCRKEIESISRMSSAEQLAEARSEAGRDTAAP